VLISQCEAENVCVLAGQSRLQSLKGALSAELITDLIIDDSTARALIANP
jgi:DNA-binding transcriptional regulator LsrR (DeoR family)